jgi:hypothetical protein
MRVIADQLPASPDRDPEVIIDACPVRHDGDLMPDLLEGGLPQPARRNKFDFTEWADGRAWRFVKGQDYDSSTETFREHIRRWAKENGYEVEFRPYRAEGADGEEIPLSRSDAIALGVQFTRRNGRPASPRRESPSAAKRPT